MVSSSNEKGMVGGREREEAGSYIRGARRAVPTPLRMQNGFKQSYSSPFDHLPTPTAQDPGRPALRRIAWTEERAARAADVLPRGRLPTYMVDSPTSRVEAFRRVRTRPSSFRWVRRPARGKLASKGAHEQARAPNLRLPRDSGSCDLHRIRDGHQAKRNPSKLAPRTGRDEGAEKSIVCLYSRSRVVDSSSSFDISSQGDLLGSRDGLLLK